MISGQVAVPLCRQVPHTPLYDDMIFCPGGRFAVVGPRYRSGQVLYYDFDQEAPVARQLVTYETSRARADIFVSLSTTASSYEFWLVVVSSGMDGESTRAKIPAHLFLPSLDNCRCRGIAQIDLWRVTLSEDYTRLQPTHVSTIRDDLGQSRALSLHGTILVRVRIGVQEEPGAQDHPDVVELVDLALSTDNQYVGARFVPMCKLYPASVSLVITRIPNVKPTSAYHFLTVSSPTLPLACYLLARLYLSTTVRSRSILPSRSPLCHRLGSRCAWTKSKSLA